MSEIEFVITSCFDWARSFGMSLSTDPILLEEFYAAGKKMSWKYVYKAVIVWSYVKFVYYDHIPRAEIHTLLPAGSVGWCNAHLGPDPPSSSFQAPPLGSNPVQIHDHIHKVMALRLKLL